MPDSSSAYTVRGGARIGLVNYSWPMATLTVTPDRLTITTTFFGLFGMGTYSFSRTQNISIVRHRGIFSDGIQVAHSVTDYPEKIVFWCRSASVLAQLSAAGFLPCPAPSSSQPTEAPRGFAFRWAPLIVLGVVWNLLFGCEMCLSSRFPPMPGPLSLVAMCMVFGVSMAAIRSSSVQRFLLKPGRAFGEVRPVVLLLAAVTGFMAVIYAIMMAAGGL